MIVNYTYNYEAPWHYYRFSVVSSPNTFVKQVNRELTQEEIKNFGEEAGIELTRKTLKSGYAL